MDNVLSSLTEIENEEKVLLDRRIQNSKRALGETLNWLCGLGCAGLFFFGAALKKLLHQKGILKIQQDEITKLNRDLEKKVEERTAELSIALVDLRSEYTKRASTEKELERLVARLQTSNEELQRFAYVASHDLQEPLRVVSNYAELVQRNYDSALDEKGKRFLNYLKDASRRMQDMVNDLLSLSRLETRAKPFTTVDLNKVANLALSNLKAVTDETPTVITLADLPKVRGDETQLVLLFQNLVANALKFRREAPVRITIDVQDLGDAFEVSVCDNGLGMESRHTERIFTIFQRLHTSDEYPGSGIGLAMCKKVVERHDGRLWVVSEKNVGSTFRFTLKKFEEQTSEV